MAEEGAVIRANAAGLKASRAWLLGKALATEVNELRVHGDDPVPAPGLPKLVDRLERDLRDVLDLTERVEVLEAGSERAVDLPAIISVELHAAEEGAAEVERISRQIAQQALGVSTGLPPGRRAERLDGAAVAVLCPPDEPEAAVSLAEDGVELFSQDRADLEVELRGLFCRMLLDGEASVRIGKVELRVGSDRTLHLSTPGGEASWPAPVEVGAPARKTIRALKELGLSVKKARRLIVVE